jgi:hypothetical protein
MICPRLTREARQLLRRIVLRHERAGLINASWEGPVQERLQVDLSIHREGSHINGRSHACDLYHPGPEFRNAQRKAAILHPVVQRTELNKSQYLPLWVNTWHDVMRVECGPTSGSTSRRRSLYGTVL